MTIGKFPRLVIVFFLLVTPFTTTLAQTAGQVMFTSFSSDGADGYSFVTLVDIPANTNIFITDNEWNGSPIGGGGAFNTGEGHNRWSHTAILPAGTTVFVTNSDIAGSITASIGTVAIVGPGTNGIDVNSDDDVLYMYLGSSSTTPTVFLSAISNENFATVGTLTGTGLTIGVNAIEFTADENFMIYTGSTNCSGTIAQCAAQIANTANWTASFADGQESDGVFPDFPAAVDCGFSGSAFGVVTYYSRQSGAWDVNATWTLNSDGTGTVAVGVWPRRQDNVVIRAGHTVTINSTSANKICGISPDDLDLANVGPFSSSNIAMFYQTGAITILGTLNVTGIEMMVGGDTQIRTGGTFSLGSNLVQLGYMEVYPGSTFSSLDDLVLTGNSVTIINTNSTSTDDLIIDHTNATLCGTGTTTLQNGSGSVVTRTNGALLNQICTTFTINCTGVGCTGFPVVGTTVVISGNTGPGGVGATNGTSQLVLWLDANRVTAANGATVTSWNDVSGYGNNFTAGNGAVFNTNNVNGYPAFSFNGTSHYFERPYTAALSGNRFTLFAVNNVVGSGAHNAVFSNRDDPAGDETKGFMLYSVPTTNEWAFWTGHATIAWEQQNTTVATTGSWATQSIEYQPGTNGKKIAINNTIALQGTTTLNLNTAQPPRVGAGRNESTPLLFYNGRMGEIIMYNAVTNDAQKTIINNYLSAKYAFNLSSNDLYTMDNAGNGNFDHQVAGIGQASDGSKHIDAQGSGVVRMRNPNNLANNEFLMWGHNNASLASTTTGVDGAIIQERLNRIWRVSEAGDVGTVIVSFDLSGIAGIALGGSMRLLIDRDGDGFADNDVAPISAGSYANNVITFTNVNFQTGDRFTLGNTTLATPLPITLVDFTATAVENAVRLNWTTASETNNDYFMVQRSREGEVWSDVQKINGAGNHLGELKYETYDNNALHGVSYYVLKQVDFDGTATYSDVRKVELNKPIELKVYPNPSSGAFHVSIGSDIEPEAVKLMDITGRIVPARVQKVDTGVTVESLQQVPGLYLIQVQKGYWKQAVRVVINP